MNTYKIYSKDALLNVLSIENNKAAEAGCRNFSVGLRYREVLFNVQFTNARTEFDELTWTAQEISIDSIGYTQFAHIHWSSLNLLAEFNRIIDKL